MLCEKCKQREAIVHKQAVVNGVSRSEHLCSVCAANEGNNWIDNIDSFFSNDFFSEEIMSDWFQPFFKVIGTSKSVVPQPKRKENNCPRCGMTWIEFQQYGLLGCSECYNHFNEQLPPLLRRLYGQSEHFGKKPYNDGDKAVVFVSEVENYLTGLSEKEKLQQVMQKAIDDENFEEAARLRDDIKALEAKEDGDSDPA